MLVDRVKDRLVERAQELIGDRALREEVDAILAGLDEPLRVVIAGRVSAGKSTLVNALLGRQVAPTGGTETTQVVTRYRYDEQGDTAELILRDGRRQFIEFDGRSLPRTLGVDPQQVSSLEVGLSIDNGILGPMMLIDTPGLDSLTPGLSGATEALLDHGTDASSRTAMAKADALIFMVNEGLLADELDVVRNFLATNPEGVSAARAIGVLSQIDLLRDPTGDPWVSAARLAEDHRDRAQGLLSAVVPVVGLLAETAETAALSDGDVAALSKLVTVDPAALAAVSRDRGLFLAADLPAPEEARKRLYESLGQYGLTAAVELLRGLDQSDHTAPVIRRQLRDKSGFKALHETLRNDFALRADALKARSAIDRVQHLLFAPASGPGRQQLVRLGEVLTEMMESWAIHQLALVEALAQVRADQVRLPARLIDDLTRMATSETQQEALGADPSDPATVEVSVRAGIRLWSRCLTLGNPRQSHIADVMTRAYTILRDELLETEPAGWAA